MPIMILVRVICFVNVQKWFYTFTYPITPLVDTFPHFFKKWNPCQWLFFLIWINKFPFRLGNWTLKKDLHLLLSRINWRSSKFRILNKIILPKIAFLSLPRIPSKIVKNVGYFEEIQWLNCSVICIFCSVNFAIFQFIVLRLEALWMISSLMQNMLLSEGFLGGLKKLNFINQHQSLK